MRFGREAQKTWWTQITSAMSALLPSRQENLISSVGWLRSVQTRTKGDRRRPQITYFQTWGWLRRYNGVSSLTQTMDVYPRFQIWHISRELMGMTAWKTSGQVFSLLYPLECIHDRYFPSLKPHRRRGGTRMWLNTCLYWSSCPMWQATPSGNCTLTARLRPLA